jgi:hypothetical protein
VNGIFPPNEFRAGNVQKNGGDVDHQPEDADLKEPFFVHSQPPYDKRNDDAGNTNPPDPGEYFLCQPMLDKKPPELLLHINDFVDQRIGFAHLFLTPIDIGGISVSIRRFSRRHAGIMCFCRLRPPARPSGAPLRFRNSTAASKQAT